MNATVLNVSRTGTLLEVSASELGLPDADDRLRPSRVLSRKLPSHFVVQFWSLRGQQWVQGQIVSSVRVTEGDGAARLAATFVSPLPDSALEAIGVLA